MHRLASLLVAAALALTPALARAQEGWMGDDGAAPRPPPAPPAALVAVVPAPAPPPAPRPVRTEMRSATLMAGGVVLAGIGTAFLAGGAYAYAHAVPPPCPGNPPSFGCALGRGFGALGEIPSIYAIAFGASLFLPGAIMIAVGASPVPARHTWELPSVSLGPRGARLTWSF